MMRFIGVVAHIFPATLIDAAHGLAQAEYHIFVLQVIGKRTKLRIVFKVVRGPFRSRHIYHCRPCF